MGTMPILRLFGLVPITPTSQPARIRRLQRGTRQSQPAHTRPSPGGRRFSPFGQGVAAISTCMHRDARSKWLVLQLAVASHRFVR